MGQILRSITQPSVPNALMTDRAGLVGIAPPNNANQQFWSSWLRHRATTKPVLWRNHRAAVATGFLEQGRSAVLVLPTGAGKTTLSELKVAATLAAGRKVIFLVPTLALVDQLRDELTDAFPSTIGAVQVAADGDLTGLLSAAQLQSIEVMTPERCLALMSHAPDVVGDVGVVVFDECHLLGSQGGGRRSLDAMLCLLHAIAKAPGADFLLLSAMLTNPDELAAWLAEITGRPCTPFQDLWKPSRQARGVVIYPRAQLVTITQSHIAAQAPQAPGVPHPHRTKKAIPHALFGLQQNWNAQLATDTGLIKLSDDPVQLSVSKGPAFRPTPNANNVAGELAVHAAETGLKTIIFVQQANHAPSTATKIAKHLDDTGALTELETILWNYVQAELGGPQFSLLTPTSAALPHNGDMIATERRLAESLFRRGGGASVIVATPTLAQGMNLPAQLAIIASDKRYGDDGRASLAAHEILNAAGRAGRAGHLANGIVLMVPEPVVSFSGQLAPEAEAFDKLRAVLPLNDRCVLVDDPITLILDEIQAGNLNDPKVRYLISRIQTEENVEGIADNVVTMVRRSFAAFHARLTNEEDQFEQKVQALQAVLAADNQVEPGISAIAASNGLAVEPLTAIKVRAQANLATLPTTLVGWSDWLIDFFAADAASYSALLGADIKTALYVMRGAQKGGGVTTAEFARLKAGLRLWLTGQPLSAIEIALGVAPVSIKHCPRARDLVLKLASRSLYLIASALSEIVISTYEEAGAAPPEPAVLEILAVAFRKGLDTPEMVAFENLKNDNRSRVLTHRSFAEMFPDAIPLVGQTYQTVVEEVTLRIAIAEI